MLCLSQFVNGCLCPCYWSMQVCLAKHTKQQRAASLRTGKGYTVSSLKGRPGQVWNWPLTKQEFSPQIYQLDNGYQWEHLITPLLTPSKSSPWPKPPSSLTRIITRQLPTGNSATRASNPLNTESGPHLSIPLQKALHGLGLALIYCASPYSPQLHRPPHFSSHTPGKLVPQDFVRLPETVLPQTVSGCVPQDLTQISPPGLWPPCPVSLFFTSFSALILPSNIQFTY